MYSSRQTFDRARHEHFAAISGDYNPIHMDPVAARRTQVGARIIHGVHSLIWALDCFSKSSLNELPVRALKAQFLRPIYLGDTVDLEISRPTPRVARIRLTVVGEEVVTVSVDFEGARLVPTPIDPYSPLIALPNTPHEWTFEELRSFRGSLAFASRTSEIDNLYPDAVRGFGTDRIGSLVNTSSLVGMVVPGLHSMYSGLELCLSDDMSLPYGRVQFVVLATTERFRLVRIGIRGQRVHGVLETISRLPPVRQPDMDTVRLHVKRDEFHGSTALIVGGSRGLGEVTAKLIAAGGGDVAITYASGSEDAHRVAEEIAKVGATCTVLNYDVRENAVQRIATSGLVPTHLYYFATPPIFRRKSSLFDEVRFSEFSDFYLKGFFAVVQDCLQLRPQGIKAFYPSSTAIDNRSASMTEYTMAKAAGEILCADMSRLIPGVRALSRRLPGLLTDQTSSVVQQTGSSAIDVLLPIVREMQGWLPSS